MSGQDRDLPSKAMRSVSRRALYIIFTSSWRHWRGEQCVEAWCLNHNILHCWMMILIQPEWESATPNQPADRCRTDWFMPRVAYQATLGRKWFICRFKIRDLKYCCKDVECLGVRWGSHVSIFVWRQSESTEWQ